MEIRSDRVGAAFQKTASFREENKVEGFRDQFEIAAKKKDEEGLREAAREFESYFIGVMLKQMRKTVVEGGLIEKSESRKQFESMLDDEYAKMLAKDEGIGLGEAIFDAMKRAYGMI
ncbi:MAG: rod-binding protein [Bacillota bacterium]|nr:rod-binding protein [Bacillota bacterium]